MVCNNKESSNVFLDGLFSSLRSMLRPHGSCKLYMSRISSVEVHVSAVNLGGLTFVVGAQRTIPKEYL